MLKTAFIVALAIMVVNANITPLCARDGRQCGGTGICKPNQGCKSCDSYLPHETDCSKFYKCDGGLNACLMNCPAGLYWNQKDSICDWPVNSGCV